MRFRTMARVLITCGPTREPLDPVRYISNASSGRTGLAIAREALDRGHQVSLVLGPVEYALPEGIQIVPVTTCDEMLKACRRLHPACQVVIGTAAVSDFRPAQLLLSKRRREEGKWTLELAPNPDILAELGAQKGRRIHVGFALQCEQDEGKALERAREKLLSKHLDWIVLNSPQALGGEEGIYILLGRSGPPEMLGRLSKGDLARRLLEVIENSLKATDFGADKNR